MKIQLIANALYRIGEYYNTEPNVHAKRITFFAAGKKLMTMFGGDFEVDDTYDFTVIGGIGEGIQNRIVSIIRGETIYELDPKNNGSIELLGKLDEVTQKALKERGIESDKDIERHLQDTAVVNILPDHVIHHFGRTRTNLVVGMIESVRYNSHIVATGSYRRESPTLKDLDFLVVDDGNLDPHEIIKEIISSNKEITFTPANDGEVMVKFYMSQNGITIKADFKVVPRIALGSAMLHFTGPTRTNIITRSQVKKAGYSLSEYGLVNAEGVNVSEGMSEVELINYLKNELNVVIDVNPAKR